MTDKQQNIYTPLQRRMAAARHREFAWSWEAGGLPYTPLHLKQDLPVLKSFELCLVQNTADFAIPERG